MSGFCPDEWHQTTDRDIAQMDEDAGPVSSGNGPNIRIVPGRGPYAGQAFVLHGCITDGPFTFELAEQWRRDLIRDPWTQEAYDDFERRGLGGMATHFQEKGAGQ